MKPPFLEMESIVEISPPCSVAVSSTKIQSHSYRPCPLEIIPGDKDTCSSLETLLLASLCRIVETAFHQQRVDFQDMACHGVFILKVCAMILMIIKNWKKPVVKQQLSKVKHIQTDVYVHTETRVYIHIQSWVLSSFRTGVPVICYSTD